MRKRIHKVTYNNGPEAMEGGKHFYLIPPTMESFSVRSVGMSAENELPLPHGVVVGPRARITCPKSPRKSALKAEFLPLDIQVA